MSKFKMSERLDLGDLATFVPNKQEPIYNWLYYKEGYAKDMVHLIIDMFELDKKENPVILDPFNGVGTTVLAAKERGMHSVGFDVSPLGVFAANVKLQDYSDEEVREAVRWILKQKFVRKEVNVKMDIVRKAYSKYALEDIYFLRDKIKEYPDKKMQDFLMLGLINTATKTGRVLKLGGSLRVDKSKHTPPVGAIFKKVLFQMHNDVRNTKWMADRVLGKIPQTENFAIQCDSRRMRLEDESVDAVITSPPYLNKIEYTNVYAIEQYLFFGEQIQKPALRSYIGDVSEADDVFEGKYKLPYEANAYFKDMKLVLEEMHRVLRKGGRAAIIVGNGCFPEGVVESDVLLAEIAERIGFRVDEIVVLRKIWCMKDRTTKVGLMNESMIVLEKLHKGR